MYDASEEVNFIVISSVLNPVYCVLQTRWSSKHNRISSLKLLQNSICVRAAVAMIRSVLEVIDCNWHCMAGLLPNLQLGRQLLYSFESYAMGTICYTVPAQLKIW